MNFSQLFKKIPPEEICYDVFTLVGKILPVITAGKINHYNSMLGKGGGMGINFGKPTTWLVFHPIRYTLELILKEKSFTLTYFDDKFREQIYFLGSKSGRNSKKMEEVKLTGIQTPCKFVFGEITTVWMKN